ncbi:MAG: hypothetical protein AB7L09_07330 [Nitrospira sp.]
MDQPHRAKLSSFRIGQSRKDEHPTGTGGLYTRLTECWNPSLGQLKLGRRGLPINIIAFPWSVFEFIDTAWPRTYAISPDAPWRQSLLAIRLVLASVLGITTLSVLIGKVRRATLSEFSS